MFWLDECRECGIDGNVFFTGRRTNRFTADSLHFPVLARPFFALNPPGLEFSVTAVTGCASRIGRKMALVPAKTRTGWLRSSATPSSVSRPDRMGPTEDG